MYKIAAIASLVLLCALACVWVFHDTFSLWYWRVRNFSTPRGVGSGPKIIFHPTRSQPIGVNRAGISVEEWKVSYDWVPATRSLTVPSSKTIITLGCWWDNFGQVTALPTDSNGKFTHALARQVGLSDGPLQNQIAYQMDAAPGPHVITPPKIGKRGDGYFLVLEVKGLDANATIRDSGQTRISHPQFGHGDKNTIQSISVSTDGTAARAGDLAVAVFSMDSFDNPDVRIDLPDSWASLGVGKATTQNIGYRACCKIVTESGRQSATCKWSDDSTFVAEATLVVFKAAPRPRP